MKNNRVAVCLDVGGSSVKSGVVQRDGTLVAGSVHVDPVDSSGTAEVILRSFSTSLERLLAIAQEDDRILDGIGVAICGPFDYERGISKIKDLDKYEALYDVNVKEYLRQSLALPDGLPLLFDVDAWSFGRGEVWAGAGQGYSRVIVFTLGTGVGSAFAVDGQIVDEGPGVPWLGWISGQPYKDGILNDYVSSVYFARRYRSLTGEELELREMAEHARQGDRVTQQMFVEMGSTLGRYVKMHHIEQFGAECIIFGGQISKSYDLFVEPFSETVAGSTSLRSILPAADIDCSTLKGAAKLVFDSLELSR